MLQHRTLGNCRRKDKQPLQTKQEYSTVLTSVTAFRFLVSKVWNNIDHGSSVAFPSRPQKATTGTLYQSGCSLVQGCWSSRGSSEKDLPHNPIHPEHISQRQTLVLKLRWGALQISKRISAVSYSQRICLLKALVQSRSSEHRSFQKFWHVFASTSSYAESRRNCKNKALSLSNDLFKDG